jgi:L-ascorbate metabolism protein UlaG (beta-lactamase superfamily)
MNRYVSALLASLLFLGSAGAADAKKLTLRWYGQSFFELTTSQGTRVVFDPHAIEEYGRHTVQADLVLISHLHNDHTQLDVIENARKAKVIFGLLGKGRKVEWNLVDERFKDIRVRTVGTYHDTTQGMDKGKNAVFVVEADRLRIVFLGDLGHVLSEGQVKEIGPVDVLVIPVGGIYTLNGSEAKRVVRQLKPRQYIVPMHYGTKVYDDLLPIDEFIDEQKNVKRFPGNKLEIDTDFKPETPVIAVLNWK